MTTELNFQRLSKGFVNVTLARRYGDLKGFFKEKITIEEREASVRNYAKYILKEGANDAKRELLDCLRSRLTLKDRRLFLL